MAIDRAAGHILLIDDSEVTLGAVADGLEKLGWTVHRALGGRAGLAALDSLRPDLVVCDLHMPDVDGLAVIRHVAEHHPGLPVVVLSGDEDLTAVLGAVRQGAFDYVVKAGADLRPLGEAVRRAFQHVQLQLQNRRLSADLEGARGRLAEQLRELTRQHDLLEREQQRSERLLLNILPRAVAERLKKDEDRSHLAERFPSVTVLFGDVVGFTPLCAHLNPDELVSLLNDLVSRFDAWAAGLGVEKIKTLGDAYMAAAGLPVPSDDHADIAALMALRMQESVAALNRERGTTLQMRIGLHTGTVVAGVIGTHKFVYDLWGDTVNVAARMESHGLPGAIQVSEATAKRLGSRFLCEPRGKVDVKGKGAMDVFLLRGLA